MKLTKLATARLECLKEQGYKTTGYLLLRENNDKKEYATISTEGQVRWHGRENFGEKK